MPVIIKIPITHRTFVKGEKSVSVQAETMSKAIEALCLRFPEIRDHLFDEEGKLHGYIEVWVNNVALFPWDPQFRLVDGDEVRISSFITGG